MFKHKDWEMGVSASDFHIPFHDAQATQLFLDFIKDYQPSYIVLDGDILDCWELSKFDRAPLTGASISDELSQGRDFLRLVRKAVPGAKIWMVEGNHEFRLRQYIMRRSKELYGLKGLTIQDQLELDKFGVEWVGTLEGASHFVHTDMKIGDLYIGHYAKVNKHAGYTAKCLLEDLGISFIQGHTHRFGVSSKTMRDGKELIGIEQGCMCDLRPKYVAYPNWQQGFCVFYKKKGKNRFQVYPIRITEYRFFWGDTEYNLDKYKS